MILSPLLLLVSFFIKIESGGPVIFKQKRVGVNSSYFTMFKFRTMAEGTPDLPSALVKENDPRFTRVGKLLRRYSIDELPQLINIIIGDMNFIGPRPALYNQFDLITMRAECDIDNIKPGITGWAQVNGRDAIPLETKVYLDKYYLNNRSLMLDIKILYMTIFKSCSGVGLHSETNRSSGS